MSFVCHEGGGERVQSCGSELNVVPTAHRVHWSRRRIPCQRRQRLDMRPFPRHVQFGGCPPPHVHRTLCGLWHTDRGCVSRNFDLCAGAASPGRPLSNGLLPPCERTGARGPAAMDCAWDLSSGGEGGAPRPKGTKTIDLSPRGAFCWTRRGPGGGGACKMF